MDRYYYTYILTNKVKTALYIGVTNDLVRRIYEHKERQKKGFTKKYRVDQLIYYEQYSEITDAIAREKRLKKWNREWKIRLINEFNHQWRDLFDDI